MLDTRTAATVGKVILLDNGYYEERIRIGGPGEDDPNATPRVEAADSKYIVPFIGESPGHIAHLETDSGRPLTVTLKEVHDA